MIIAFLSDIHGNLPALRAALTDACNQGAEKIYCSGDLTGYGPFPKEVCHFLRKRHIASIIGNYDAKVISAMDHPSSFKKRMKPGKWKILEWTIGQIDNDTKRYLMSLPLFLRERLADRFELLMSHGSPVSAEDTIYPSITTYGLKTKLRGESPDILVCGHTHIPFIKRVAGTLVVNCGSTGLSVDGDPRPSYALVKIVQGKSLSARIIRFDYPQDDLLRALDRPTFPKGLAADFREGKKKKELS